MKQYELSDGDCNQQVTDDHLELISRSSCKQWKSLPSHLGMDTIAADDIDKGQKEEREKRHDFFLKWKETKGSQATYKQLITALLKIKCTQDAEGVCEVLKESVALQRLHQMLKGSVLPQVLISDTASALPTLDTIGMGGCMGL